MFYATVEARTMGSQEQIRHACNAWWLVFADAAVCDIHSSGMAGPTEGLADWHSRA
jgi:hypothetical protein